MPIDDYRFRPITFQGVTFPPTVMAISILEPVLGITDEELGDWLWRFPICCGFPKRSPAELCERCAQRTLDLMLEQRDRVLRGISERLAPIGFDPESTYRDWASALQVIVELSRKANGECVRSAPMHANDPLKNQADVERLLESLEKERTRGNC